MFAPLLLFYFSMPTRKRNSISPHRGMIDTSSTSNSHQQQHVAVTATNHSAASTPAPSHQTVSRALTVGTAASSIRRSETTTNHNTGTILNQNGRSIMNNNNNNSSTAASSRMEMDTVFATMRATLLQYRDAVEINEDEKSEMLDTIRVLRVQLGHAKQDLKEERIRNESLEQRLQEIINSGNFTVPSHLPPSAPVSRNNSPSRTRLNSQNNNNNNNINHPANTSARSAHSTSSNSMHHHHHHHHFNHNPNEVSQIHQHQHQQDSSRAMSASGSSSKSPERMSRELKIANEKMDSLARELQRVHSDYQTEIKRLRAQNLMTQTKYEMLVQENLKNSNNNNNNDPAADSKNRGIQQQQQQPQVNNDHAVHQQLQIALVSQKTAEQKLENQSKEIQRIHQEYQAEIRRLHRMIAKLEGQVVELTEYSLVATAQQEDQLNQLPQLR